MSMPESLPLRLTRRERALVIQEAFLTDDLQLKLRFGQVEGNMLVFDMAPDQLAELGRRLVDAANRASDSRIQGELGDVITRVDGLMGIADPTGEVLPQALGVNLPEPLRQALLEIMQNPEVTSLEEAGKRLAEKMEREMGQKRDDLGGLTPIQVIRLVESPWEGKNSAVRLNELLPLADLEGIMLFKNARTLLRALKEAPIKATEAGNLPRKYVERIVEKLELPKGFLETERAVSKVLNEKDIAPLHLPRVLLQTSNLIAVKSSHYRVTKKGQSLLADEKAGALFAQLFRALYKRMNTDYFDRMPEVADIQENISYSLYAIKQHADDWVRADELADEIFLPYVKLEIPPDYAGHENYESFANARVFYHLQRFGLMERRHIPEPTHVLGCIDEVRKTPLYDRFIDFDLAE